MTLLKPPAESVPKWMEQAVAEAIREVVAEPPPTGGRAGTTLSRAANWRQWLPETFPSFARYPFAVRHSEFWDWVWRIELEQRPRPFVAIWPRGGAKSSSAERAIGTLGIRGKRKYFLYVCDTQEQADKHVASIATPLEAIGTERAVNKYGSSKGWRRNRLRTAGFTVDALGLDVAARGIKVDEDRPDFICLDDIDDRFDSPVATKKKLDTIADSILPSGTPNLAVLAVQNIIHPGSIFAKLADGTADILKDRIISGPHPAILGLQYDTVHTSEGDLVRIIGGEPTWAGQDISACENIIKTSGLRSFLRECQHRLDDAEGALWRREWIDKNRLDAMPIENGKPMPLVDSIVGLDPSATATKGSDEAGIVVAGKGANLHGYIQADYSLRGTPIQWATRAICAVIIHNTSGIVAEVNQGGEMVRTVINSITRDSVATELEAMGYSRDRAKAGSEFSVRVVHASVGKAPRAEPVSVLYSQGRAHHVGRFSMLEDELTNWLPGTLPSPNRLDALVWAIKHLGLADDSEILYGAA